MPEGELRRAGRRAPRAALVFALTTALLLTGRAQGYPQTVEESENEPTDGTQEVELTDEETAIISTVPAVTPETSIDYTNSTLIDEDDNQLEFILMVLIPLILLALLLLSVVVIIINHKRKKTKQEPPSSQGSQSALQSCYVLFKVQENQERVLFILFNRVAWRLRIQTLETLCLGGFCIS